MTKVGRETVVRCDNNVVEVDLFPSFAWKSWKERHSGDARDFKEEGEEEV